MSGRSKILNLNLMLSSGRLMRLISSETHRFFFRFDCAIVFWRVKIVFDIKIKNKNRIVNIRPTTAFYSILRYPRIPVIGSIVFFFFLIVSRI